MNTGVGCRFLGLPFPSPDPIISWEIDGETVETVLDFILLGSKITADGDCSHEIKRCLLLGHGVAFPGHPPWPQAWGSSSWPPPLGHGVLPASAPDLGRRLAPLGRTMCAVAAAHAMIQCISYQSPNRIFDGTCWDQRRGQWHPPPVLLPEESHGWRSLVGCSPWGRYELDMTERLHFHFSLSCTGEGNGTPLQCSSLENSRDGGA